MLDARVAVGLLLAAGAMAGCLDGSDAGTGDSAATALQTLAMAEPAFPLFDHMQRSREFDVATDPSDPDRLATGFIEMRTELGWVGIGRSADGGKTWSTAHLCGYALAVAEGDDPAKEATCPITAGRPGAFFAGDPVLVFLPDGTLLMGLIVITPDSLSMVVARFEGESLEPSEVNLVARSARDFVEGAQLIPGTYRVYYNDKEQMDLDPDTGRLYFGWSGIYRAGSPGNQVVSTRGYPHVSWSDDHGRTWATPTPVIRAWEDSLQDGSETGFNMQTWPIALRDGRVLVFWINLNNGQLMMAESTDRAESFGDAMLLNESLQDANKMMGGQSIPSVAIDRTHGPRDGWLYLAYVAEYHGDQDTYLLRSRDGGVTWDTPIRVNQDPVGNGRDQFLPEIVVEPDGAIAIVTLDQRDAEDPESEYHPYLARSVDGGATWAEIRLADEVSSTHNMGAHRPPYNPGEFENLGDYQGISYNRDGPVAIWQDMREYSTGYVGRVVAR